MQLEPFLPQNFAIGISVFLLIILCFLHLNNFRNESLKLQKEKKNIFKYKKNKIDWKGFYFLLLLGVLPFGLILYNFQIHVPTKVFLLLIASTTFLLGFSQFILQFIYPFHILCLDEGKLINIRSTIETVRLIDFESYRIENEILILKKNSWHTIKIKKSNFEETENLYALIINELH